MMAKQAVLGPLARSLSPLSGWRVFLSFPTLDGGSVRNWWAIGQDCAGGALKPGEWLKLENATTISKTQLFWNELLSLQTGEELLELVTRKSRNPLPSVSGTATCTDPGHTKASTCEGKCYHSFSYHNKMVPQFPGIIYLPEHPQAPGSLVQKMPCVCWLSVPDHFFFNHIPWQRTSFFLSICPQLAWLLFSATKSWSETSFLPLQILVTLNSGWK